MGQEWWAPRTSGHPSVVLPVPLAEVPELLDRAVHAVPGAAAMEVRPDGAVIGRRTSFALRAENIVMTFSREDRRPRAWRSSARVATACRTARSSG
ncbi:hypothetical protein [Curtobacterium sp. B18]|uniref:hypothetical protein n=1 Tax=Curtobacterium sp. B18 TaxID=95614 RepID=UPI0011D1FCD8|nr:hypothetical protein [Curtobacterium sp. B18]